MTRNCNEEAPVDNFNAIRNWQIGKEVPHKIKRGSLACIDTELTELGELARTSNKTWSVKKHFQLTTRQHELSKLARRSEDFSLWDRKSSFHATI